jgi:hypothetical protein
MGQIALNSLSEYSAALYTTDPLKIGFLLNQVIHNPDSAILVEPIKNEYWIFYTGSASFPEESHSDIKHFQIDDKQNENLEISDDSVSDSDRWFSEIVKIQQGEIFVADIFKAINSIRNKNSIRIAVEQGEGVNRKLHFYYKK